MVEGGEGREDMAGMESCICAICFEAPRDARLLNCLHSFCKSCLDDLDMRTGHEHKIACPVCRSTSHLPENGASGLARDITVQGDLACKCHTCSSGDGAGKPVVSCVTCNLTFCGEHVVAHILSTGHAVGPLPKAAAATTSVRLCEEHGLPVKYVCKQCDTPVCAECVAGGHRKHEPIVAFKAIAVELRQEVRRKTDELKNARLPEVQRCLSAIEDVSSQLSSNAKSVRNKIRASAKRVHDMVDLVMEQKLAKVDDLEELRHKHLNNQHGELKEHTESLKSVVRFGEKMLEADAETEYVRDLLWRVGRRADELDTASVAMKPVEHAQVDFESVSEETLLAKVNELVGVVLPGHASAKYSFIEGETTKVCEKGSSVSFVVVAKDSSNCRLDKGGDVIRTKSRWQTPETQQCVDITDCDNGTYRVTVSPRCHGDCTLDVFVNKDKLQQPLVVICGPLTFDPAECQAQITLSEDKCKMTHTGINGRYSSVLGSHGMLTGEYNWKVKVRKRSQYIMLGVAEKPGLTARQNNCSLTYSFWGVDGSKCVMGRSSPGTCQWQESDVLQFHLNCTEHSLSIRNLRSGETDTIMNLPHAELFAYFLTTDQGTSIRLVH